MKPMSSKTVSNSAISVSSHPVTIGEAARRTGLTPRAIRLYEDSGFFTARRDRNDVRFYDEATVERLGHVARFRSLGLSLREIRELIGLLDAEGPGAMKLRLVDLLTARAEWLEAQRRDVERTKGRLITEGVL